MTSQVSQSPVMKAVMNGLQVLFITFICWLGNNISSSVKGSVTDFSNKLDGVVKSIGEIAAKQTMTDRDVAALTLRVGKLEDKNETLVQQAARLGFKVEQLEREQGNGR
ncbi:hypothetical protein [Pseudomonas sp. TWP3-2]|uniref:hypothetical protein n=1 Tax=Pseudomonas sp. TWP3-2 TaxID=2804574 RepID=UPI003CF840C0